MHTHTHTHTHIHNSIASTTSYSSYAFLFTDPNITLTGEQNILMRSVAIQEAGGGDRIIACAPIVAAETLIATYSFMKIEQDSAFENSTLTLDASYPPNNPDVAIYEAVFMTSGLCPADDSPYNPFEVTSSGGK